MSKVKVELGKLNDLLYAISLSDDLCALCPNCKISCPCLESNPDNTCQGALYKYLQGEEND